MDASGGVLRFLMNCLNCLNLNMYQCDVLDLLYLSFGTPR